MSQQFVYVTYIRTTPETLFAALTQPEFTKKYWVESWPDCEWTIGASWKLMTPDGRTADSGEVLEYDPPKRFAVSWQNHLSATAQAEGHSRCTFDLEPMGDTVKLTVTHEFKTAESELYKGVSGGWPMILASLKSLLETDDALEATKKWPEGV
jgi:uncharacterized protein YndB with AHSA1/START domain